MLASAIAASNRQGESKCAALAQRAFRFNAPAMRLYQVTSNSQSQPAATAPPTRAETGFRPCAIHFIKAFKDAGQVFGRNADPGIPHKETLRSSRAVRARADDHRAA